MSGVEAPNQARDPAYEYLERTYGTPDPEGHVSDNRERDTKAKVAQGWEVAFEGWRSDESYVRFRRKKPDPPGQTPVAGRESGDGR